MSKATKKNVWVPEYKFESLDGTFVDYTGNLREFTMVAVSIPLTTPTYVSEIVELPEDLNENEEILEYNENTDTYEEVDNDTLEFSETTILDEVTKVISFGVSVRNVNDKKIEGLSTRIAYGKAVTLRDHCIYLTDPGMAKSESINAFLQQEALHFANVPGKYLKGYDTGKAKYEKNLKQDNVEVCGSAAPVENADVQRPVTNIDNYSSVANNNLREKLMNEA